VEVALPNTTAVLVVVIALGASVAVQGLLAIWGKRAARPNFFERPLIEALELKEPAEVSRVLGRIRLIYGIFLIATGAWAMTV
jgi:hypothetical protein